MIGMNRDHCHVVNDSLTGVRPVDTKALESLAVLKDRLDNLQKMDSRFAAISFSPMAEQMSVQAGTLAVG
ncbi:MAG: hypothetical protein GY809_17715 [Planctomycetes bacterium]|nr:hypothetical protein [Planctomycetota bacterium]